MTGIKHFSNEEDSNDAIVAHPNFVSSMQTLTDYSEKHKCHVARLWAEAQELVSDLEVVQGEYYRAKNAYEQACIQASRCAYTPPYH